MEIFEAIIQIFAASDSPKGCLVVAIAVALVIGICVLVML